MKQNPVNKNLHKMIANEQAGGWVRIMQYNSPSGASGAINAIKNGKTGVPTLLNYPGYKGFAFTARTFGEKSRLYAYLIMNETPDA